MALLSVPRTGLVPIKMAADADVADCARVAVRVLLALVLPALAWLVPLLLIGRLVLRP